MEKKVYLLLASITILLIAIGIIFGKDILTIIGIAVAITTGILGILKIISFARSKQMDFLVNTEAF